MLLLPVTIVDPVLLPIAMLPLPVMTFSSAVDPTPTLLCPLVLLMRAAPPTATLPPLKLFVFRRALKPRPVLTTPGVIALPANTPRNVLLSPRFALSTWFAPAETRASDGRTSLPVSPTSVPSFVRALLAAQPVPLFRSVWLALPTGNTPPGPPVAATVSVCPEGVMVTLDPAASVTSPERPLRLVTTPAG